MVSYKRQALRIPMMAVIALVGLTGRLRGRHVDDFMMMPVAPPGGG